MKSLRRQPRAFTLTEIMIAVAMMLLLMVGINQVFRMTSETVGTGMSISESLRGLRSTYDSLRSDFVGYKEDKTTGIVETKNLPALVIRSQRIAAFLDRADELADAGDGVETVDLDQDGGYSSLGENLTRPADMRVFRNRNHRIDTLSFFSRGEFKRRTGQSFGGERFVADQVSNEAWIWYGHVMQPNNNANPTMAHPVPFWGGGDYYPPGWISAQANPNNYYASSWVLGRMAILLKPKLTGSQREYFDAAGNSYVFIGRNPGTFSMEPLGYGSRAATTSFNNVDQPYDRNSTHEIQWSYYDVAATEIGASDPARGYWAIVRNQIKWHPADWWRPLVHATGRRDHAYRFNCNMLVQKPLVAAARGTGYMAPASQKLAESAPALLPGCTQFIVEFAGDFDGQPGIDLDKRFLSDNDPLNDRVQWYGLPRDVDGDGDWDVHTVAALTEFRHSFEREVPGMDGVPADRYTCVWGPIEFAPTESHMLGQPVQKPSLIRITLTAVDPRRPRDGLTQEYVFKVR